MKGLYGFGGQNTKKLQRKNFAHTKFHNLAAFEIPFWKMKIDHGDDEGNNLERIEKLQTG